MTPELTARRVDVIERGPESRLLEKIRLKKSFGKRSDGEGPRKKDRRRRSTIEGLQEKGHRRRSAGEGPQEKVRQRKFTREGP